MPMNDQEAARKALRVIYDLCRPALLSFSTETFTQQYHSITGQPLPTVLAATDLSSSEALVAALEKIGDVLPPSELKSLPVIFPTLESLQRNLHLHYEEGALPVQWAVAIRLATQMGTQATLRDQLLRIQAS